MLIKDKTLMSIHTADTRPSATGRIFRVPTGVEKISDNLFGDYIKEQTELLEKYKEEATGRVYRTRLDMIDEITTIILPKTLKEIGENAFRGLKNLTHVNLPANLERIGKRAFYECESIYEISLPKSIKSVGNGAFERCDGLLKVFLPVGLKIDKGDVFWNCSHVEFFRYKKEKDTIKTEEEPINPHQFLSTDSLFYKI